MTSAQGGRTTATMQRYDGAEPAGQDGGSGLVLLYAAEFARLPACFPLPGGAVVIGREAPADIVIPQPAVSRAHARLDSTGQGWLVTDLGGRNGTLVNGAFVRECELFPGDQLRVGDCFFELVSAGAGWYARYRIDGAVVSPELPRTPPGVVGGYQLALLTAELAKIAPSNLSVVVSGESGTGKEVFARLVHAWSGRSGAFCALNCAAIPPQLCESELFGYRRGAFSGADRDHPGLVRAADGGSLFLDEVGDLPLESQAKLLRVLQEREVLPLGATRAEPVDVRFVCATHRDLQAMVLCGAFRGDLYARLNEYRATLPPLRERKEDLYGLCLAFLRQQGRPELRLSVPFLAGLFDYDFPYNVRELEALLKRAVALAPGPALEANHLSEPILARMASYGRRNAVRASAPPTPREREASYADPPLSETAASALPKSALPKSALPKSAPASLPAEAELRALLAAAKGNVAAVGRHYGKERMQVHRWMKKYNIDPDEYR